MPGAPDPVRLTGRYHTRGSLSPADIRSFRTAVMERFRANPRPMPWRETHDPYAILVSEIMLQQTQVERVRIKYSEFMASFPDCTALAAAPLEQVLAVWQGLGYNRRALALKRCAAVIAGRPGSDFPRSIPDLEQLPGIGPYTARAVAAFAFGVAEPLIETNIRTLYIHFFFHDREKVDDREILPLVEATLVRETPREWYYALMDYGAYLKREHPNPGRRSRHHQRQSRFEGSNRQLRSRMLRAVMEQPGVTRAELLQLLGCEDEALAKNLAGLEQEGFITERHSGYAVRGK